MRRRRGFTLFELILVMAIMLIVAGLATPMIYEAMYSDNRVISAADTVRARFADCRSQAMEEGRNYQFSIVPNSGLFRVEPSTVDGVVDPNAPGLVIEGVLPKGVRFGTADHPVDPDSAEVTGGQYVPIAVFLPDGTAQDDVDVNFGTKNAMHVTLRLKGWSGTTTTIRGEEVK